MKIVNNLLKHHEVLENRWEVKFKLGCGGFGQVYKVIAGIYGCFEKSSSGWDQKEERFTAIKVEPRGPKEVLAVEIAVLQALKGNSKHIPGIFGLGQTPSYNYVIMELLSKNLTQLRQDSPHLKFSMKTTFNLAMQSLEGIRDLHTAGYLHRDIKPSNFVMGLEKSFTSVLFIIDFGLVRTLNDAKTGKLKEARPMAGFRGTVRYASMSAHEGRDLGRHDDLWSLFYMLVEMSKGRLPWRRIKNKVDVGRFKKRTSVELLAEDIHPLMIDTGKFLETLTFNDTPNYELIHNNFKAIHQQYSKGQPENANSLDWEETPMWTTLNQELSQRLALSKRVKSGAASKPTPTTCHETNAEKSGSNSKEAAN